MTGGSDGDIHLWNPHTARLIKTYPAHGHSVLSLALFAMPPPPPSAPLLLFSSLH